MYAFSSLLSIKLSSFQYRSIKFPIDSGVGKVASIQRTSRRCYLTATENKELSKILHILHKQLSSLILTSFMEVANALMLNNYASNQIGGQLLIFLRLANTSMSLIQFFTLLKHYSPFLLFFKGVFILASQFLSWEFIFNNL